MGLGSLPLCSMHILLHAGGCVQGLRPAAHSNQIEEPYISSCRFHPIPCFTD